jgi:methylated-DNA-[protein]-cysteine S-methyltransferase
MKVLMPSPIGPLGIEVTGWLLNRLIIAPAEPAAFTPLHDVDGSDFLDEVFGRLSEYFAGARRQLDLEYELAPPAEPQEGQDAEDGFVRRVLAETCRIPYGKMWTFARLAEAAGRPHAEREVMAILLENTLPIVIPCHRVVYSRTSLGDYVGGAERKRWLLELERGGAELED